MKFFFNRPKVFFAVVIACVVAAAAISACRFSPAPSADSDLFVPGVGAAGVLLGVDDSNAVRTKIGPPEAEKHLRGNGIIWVYPSRGMALQFGELSSTYHSPLDADSTVLQIFLFTKRIIDSTEIEQCTLHTREGVTLLSPPTDFIRLLGEPSWLDMPAGQRMEPEATVRMYYPGMLAPFSEGKINSVTLRFFPPTDSAVLKRVVNQPIIAGKSAAGVSLGMTPEQVRSILGPTTLKMKKVEAEYWFYPQYAVKIQFGIPPTEGMHSQALYDSTYADKVTGIITLARTVFDGEAIPVNYTGVTAGGLHSGQKINAMRELLGDPVHYASEAVANAKGITMFTPPGTLVGGTGMCGLYPFYLYDGIAFFENRVDSTIDHIIVTYTQLPFESGQ